MTKKVQQFLLTWYCNYKRDLPWRKNVTPYRVWISEVMLQQTTVSTVENFFIRFMNAFPSLSDLAGAEEEEVLKLWAGLGYYSRARNVLKTAKLLKNESQFPNTFSELLALPGVGLYTASAIHSIAFNQASAVVDTNVDRVIGRFLGLDRSNKLFNKIVYDSAHEMIQQVSPEYVSDWNQALMELGALVCKPQLVDCQKCPIRMECVAARSEDPLIFPGNKLKPQITKIEEVVQVIYCNDCVVLSKITEGTRRKGLYDFPTSIGLVEDNCYSINYRISNYKVKRFFSIVVDNQYQLKEYEVLVKKDQLIDKYPLVSPCKKYITAYILSKC